MSNDLQKTPVAIANGMVQITSIDEGFRFATLVHQSGMAPSSFKSPQAIMIAVQMGAELGLTPMMSLKVLSVINGRAGIGGKDVPSIVLRSGLLEKFEETFEGSGDDLRAVCRVKRKGLDGERVCTFSVADAKRAGLWGTGTWSKYPRDMLCYKARARAFQLFSDVLAGLPVAEDIQEVPPQGVQVPGAKKARKDPLLKAAPGEVIETPPQADPPPAEEAEAEAVVETVADTQTVGETTEPDAAPSPDPSAGLPFDADEPQDQPVPENADLIAALDELASGTAGRSLNDLRVRVDRANKLMDAQEWRKARAKLGLKTNKELADLNEAGLRKMLCACVEAVE